MRTVCFARLAFLKVAGVKFNVAVAVLTAASYETLVFVWLGIHGSKAR